MKIGDFSCFHNYRIIARSCILPKSRRDNTQKSRDYSRPCASPFFNPLEIEGVSLPAGLSLLVIIYSEPYPASGWFRLCRIYGQCGNGLVYVIELFSHIFRQVVHGLGVVLLCSLQ